MKRVRKEGLCACDLFMHAVFPKIYAFLFILMYIYDRKRFRATMAFEIKIC